VTTAPAGALAGVGVSPGAVVGPVRRMADPVGQPPAGPPVEPGARDAEAARIATAMAEVRDDLTARAGRASGDAAEVLEATALMAADPALAAAARERVVDRGLRAEVAVWDAAGEIAATLAALGGYLGERARDVHDVRDRIVAVLTGRPAPGVPSPGHPFVLVARDLAPADTATLDPAAVLAIVTEAGGPTSHTAILARSLGIPAVVAVPGAAGLADGTEVLVDGRAGTVSREVSDADRERVARLARTARRTFGGRGRTADGTHVPLLANVGDVAGAEAAATAGAEGVGLFRTEFCFLDRHDAPSVEEQIGVYSGVLAAFAGRRVVVRTLDAGADKPMPFMSSDDVPGEEPNPALGVRGLRTSWHHPHLLDDQLRAVAEAARASAAEVWVMAPMVATADEAESFVARCAAHGLERAGVMVEVPAAALTADAVLAHAAFASLGTNDLLQYTTAADRMLPSLVGLNDPYQPALLHLVRATCEAGARRSRPVGVCGEAAADPALACVLVGLGATSLSMSPAALPDVAAALGGASDEDCRRAARAALAAPTAAAARAVVRTTLPHLAELGL
jgi:phosphotransferase system enzyme I (PtsI)